MGDLDASTHTYKHMACCQKPPARQLYNPHSLSATFCTATPSCDNCNIYEDTVRPQVCHLTVTAVTPKRLTLEHHLLSEPKSKDCHIDNRARRSRSAD